LALADRRCRGMLHRGGWYEARCGPGFTFADFRPGDILFAELAAGSGRPFVHTDILANAPPFELVMKRVPPSAETGTILPPDEPADLEAALPIALKDIAIEGSVPREMAELVWDLTSAPFLRCLRSVVWANRRPGPEGDVKLGLNVVGNRSTVVSRSLDDNTLG